MRRFSLPRFPWWLLTPFRALLALFKRFNAHDGLQTAASLTYTTLFAVVPLTTVAYSLFAAIPEFQEAGDRIQQFVFQQFVPETGQTILDTLRGFTQQARGLTMVGVVFLLVTSILMMMTVENALNRIWGVRHNRHGLMGFLVYWAVLTLGPILIGSGFLLSSYLASISVLNSAASWLGGSDFILHFLPPILSFLAFLFIYITVPNARVRFRHAAAGALLVSVSLELAKWGFSIFVTNFPSYQILYGAFAAVPLFLIWIFLSWFIILMGAELAAWLGEIQRADWRRWPLFWQAVGMLTLLHRTHARGEGALTASSVRKRLGGHYHKLLSVLSEQGWIVIGEEDEWVLARPLDTLTLSEVVAGLPWAMPEQYRPPEGYSKVADMMRTAQQRYHDALDVPMASALADDSDSNRPITP
ncbi:YihY family inner membrane protein [Kushneria sp. AK178]